MSREVAIITPEFEPGAGGVADYTLRVVENWPGSARLRFIVPETAPSQNATGGAPLRVTQVARQPDSLLNALPQKEGALLLQYSAYGFDHFGFPRWLFRGLLDWKDRTDGSLVIMFHEIWAFWPVFNKNYFLQRLHRRAIRDLIASADAVFTSTASQAQHLRRLSRGREITVLPVGSNVRLIGNPPAERQSGVAVVFGLQQSRCRVLETMTADLQALAREHIVTKLIAVGTGGVADERERALLSSLNLRDGFEQRGQMAEQELSDLLLSASFGISTQDELSVTKSGTFMAYAAHGLNVVSPFANARKPEPLCWLVAPAELRGEISPDELANRAKRLRDWQTNIASWSAIAGQFATALACSPAVSEKAQ